MNDTLFLTLNLRIFSFPPQYFLSIRYSRFQLKLLLKKVDLSDYVAN